MSQLGKVNPAGTGKLPSLPKSDEGNESYPAKAESLQQEIAKVVKERIEPIRAIKAFGSRSTVSRMMLNSLVSIVNRFTTLKDLENRYAILQFDWLLYCGKTEEQLEEEEHPQRPSIVETEMEVVGEIIDKAEEMFQKIKEVYPKNQVVIDHLDFIDKAPIL